MITTFLHNASRRTRRAMHASCESPWYLSAKHCLLETCFLLTVPLQEHAAHVTRWPITLSSKGSSGTCIPEVLRHSSILLHGATKRVLMPTWADSCSGFGRVRIGHPLTSYRLLTYITRRPSAAPVYRPWVVPPITVLCCERRIIPERKRDKLNSCHQPHTRRA